MYMCLSVFEKKTVRLFYSFVAIEFCTFRKVENVKNNIKNPRPNFETH